MAMSRLTMESADEKKPPQGQVEVLIVQDGTLTVAFTDDGYVAGLGLQSRGDGAQQPKPDCAQLTGRCIVSRMDLKTFLFSMPVVDRHAFAERCGTSYGHLRNIAYGDKSCAETLALHVERESGGVVSIGILRPDLKRALDQSGYVKAEQIEHTAI
jgi:DNA-binding transcriptional regulator YdaS (Cro superfamily)